MLLGAIYNTAPALSTTLNGRVFAAGFYDHAITPEAVQFLTRGNWTELVWQPRRSYFMPVAAGGTNVPAAAYHQRHHNLAM